MMKRKKSQRVSIDIVIESFECEAMKWKCPETALKFAVLRRHASCQRRRATMHIYVWRAEPS